MSLVEFGHGSVSIESRGSGFILICETEGFRGVSMYFEDVSQLKDFSQRLSRMFEEE
jgi:hypothetical protein